MYDFDPTMKVKRKENVKSSKSLKEVGLTPFGGQTVTGIYLRDTLNVSAK